MIALCCPGGLGAELILVTRPTTGCLLLNNKNDIVSDEYCAFYFKVKLLVTNLTLRPKNSCYKSENSRVGFEKPILWVLHRHRGREGREAVEIEMTTVVSDHRRLNLEIL